MTKAEKKLKPKPKAKAKKANTQLVQYDALSAYLSEISKYQRITKEEEHELAVTYQKNKDLKAAYRLVSSNLWLVVKIAREYEKAARNLLDLVQEGNMGLMEAVKSFDPYRDVRLPSYAVWWIRAYIIRYLIANWRMVKIGTTQAQRKLFFNLKKEKDKLEREGIFPSPKLIADRLNVREWDVVEMEQRMGSSDVSVDAPVDESNNSLHSILPDKNESAEEALSHKEIQKAIQEGLSRFAQQLNSREKQIFEKRLMAEEKSTLQNIAEELQLSTERIRQIEVSIKKKLKDFFETNYAGIIEDIEF